MLAARPVDARPPDDLLFVRWRTDATITVAQSFCSTSTERAAIASSWPSTRASPSAEADFKENSDGSCIDVPGVTVLEEDFHTA